MKKKILGAIAFCAVCTLGVNANSNVQLIDDAQTSATEVMQEPEEDSVVKQIVAENSKQLPAAVAEGMVLAMMEAEDGDVVYVYKVTDAVFQQAAAMGAEACSAQSLAQTEAQGANDPLTVAMIEEGYGVVIIYVNEKNDEKFIFGASAEDFANAALKSQEEGE